MAKSARPPSTNRFSMNRAMTVPLYLTRLGSSASRSASPNMLKASTSTKIMTPGKKCTRVRLHV